MWRDMVFDIARAAHPWTSGAIWRLFSRLITLTSKPVSAKKVWHGVMGANYLALLIGDFATIFEILPDFGCWGHLPMISSAHRGRDASGGTKF